MNKKRVAINMTAQLLAFGVNMLLGFVLVPVIEAMIPNAYGFTDIANKFVSAAQIVVSALKTMASRFITIRIHRNEQQEAEEYFSSVFFANVLMAVVLHAPGPLRGTVYRKNFPDTGDSQRDGYSDAVFLLSS